jgi:hypothetical protein
MWGGRLELAGDIGGGSDDWLWPVDVVQRAATGSGGRGLELAGAFVLGFPSDHVAGCCLGPGVGGDAARPDSLVDVV